MISLINSTITLATLASGLTALLANASNGPVPASRHASARPMTPPPMMATRGRADPAIAEPAGEAIGDWTCDKLSLIGISLRWYDPDRFDGCDLSRA